MRLLEWMGKTKEEFGSWPLSQAVRIRFYDALRSLQAGEKDPPSTKWLSSLHPQCAEIKISGYRLVAHCEYGDVVYVVHAFKKDSAKGRKTRQSATDLVENRIGQLALMRESSSKSKRH